MSVLLATYGVSDLERFRTVFDALDPTRREHGSTGHRLLRSADDPTRVVVLIDFGSRQEADAFAGSAARAEALQEAGVVSRVDEILEDVG